LSEPILVGLIGIGAELPLLALLPKFIEHIVGLLAIVEGFRAFLIARGLETISSMKLTVETMRKVTLLSKLNRKTVQLNYVHIEF